MSTLEQTLEDFSPTAIESKLSDLLRTAVDGADQSEEIKQLVQSWNDEMQAECDSLGDSHEARAEGRVRMEMRRALVYFSAGLLDLADEAVRDALVLSDNSGQPALMEMVQDLDRQLFD